MSRPERDTNRKSVYTVEDYAFEGTVLNETVSGDEAVGFARRLAGSDWFAQSFPGVSFTARTMRSDATSSSCAIKQSDSQRFEIRLASTQWQLWTAAHEIAHGTAFAQDQSAGATHGKLWRRHYVVLVHAMFGAEWADRLEYRFAADGLAAAPAVVLKHAPFVAPLWTAPTPKVGGRVSPLARTEPSATRPPIAL